MNPTGFEHAVKNISTEPRRISFLYTNIGRGHPFYLDGIIDSMVRRSDSRLVHNTVDVFEISSGNSRLGWQAARWLYRRGSSPGPVSRIYSAIRSNQDFNRRGFLLSLLKRDIVRKYASGSSPLVVAHPILVACLKGRANLIYQHGELVAPMAALVAGASKVIVPTDTVADAFEKTGYGRKDIFISGLCIEPALVGQAFDSLKQRKNRMEQKEPLTGAFYSSGAEPAEHVAKLVLGATSVVNNGGRAILFVRAGGSFLKQSLAALENSSIQYRIVDSADDLSEELPQALVVRFDSRRIEDQLSARLFSSFDYLVAPAHERSNWALGLGLPMLAVGPAIGPFAPLNRDLVVQEGVAISIESNQEAARMGVTIEKLRQSGRLEQMAGAGWGRRRIDGFDNIAQFLTDSYG